MIYNESKYNAHWDTKKLNQLGTFSRGKSKHRPRNDPRLYANGRYPLIQTGDIKAANLFITTHSQEYGDFGLQQSKLWNTGTLCITIAANIAETGILAYPMCFPDSVVGFNAYADISSEFFMHYVFRYIRNAIQNSVSGSIQDNINIEYLSNLDFKVPDKPYQDKIVYVLSSIDKKIELNNRIIVELEAMAKTIYDYWFVQFNFPNAEGKPYRFSGGEMVWNEQLKREIPKGWNVGTIKPFINVIRGVTYEKDDVQDAQSSGYICLLRANNIANGNINYDNVVYVKENKISKEQLLMQNDVFICMSSGSKDHIGKTAIVTADIGCSFGAFCSKIEIQSCAFSWLALYFRSKYFNSYIRNTCLGTNINNLNNDMLYNIVLPIPPEYVLQRFNAIIHPMIAKMGNTHVESIELEHLRDWLLPMLMNGQVNVK